MKTAMRMIWTVLAIAAAAALSGCVDNGGPGYVESRVINEGRVGAPYVEGRVASAGAVVGGPTYAGERQPAYRDRYAEPRPRGAYADRGYDGRDGYRRYGDRSRDHRDFCADVGYDDPRCE